MAYLITGRKAAAMLSVLGLAVLSAVAFAEEGSGDVASAGVPSIQLLSFSGSGCLRPDTSAWPGIGGTPEQVESLLMSEFGSTQNTSDAPNRLTSECTIRFKVLSPDGKPYDLTRIVYRGFADMSDSRGRGSVAITYGAEGRTSAVTTTRAVPTTMDAISGVVQVPRSRCGVNDIHQLKIVTRLAPSARPESFAIDSVELAVDPKQLTACL